MNDKAALAERIRQEERFHPCMTAQDLRKLVYQSVFGGDHLLADRAQFAVRLAAEWAALDTTAWDVPALQPIDPEGRTARIHLGPCKRAGVSRLLLTELLLAQPLKHGQPRLLARRWSQRVALANEGRIGFPAETVASLDPHGAPSHHSRGYGRAAYRIIHDLGRPETQRGLAELGILS